MERSHQRLLLANGNPSKAWQNQMRLGVTLSFVGSHFPLCVSIFQPCLLWEIHPLLSRISIIPPISLHFLTMAKSQNSELKSQGRVSQS